MMVKFWSQSSSVSAITASLFLLLVAGPRSVSSVPLDSFYPYGTAAGDNTLARNDDGSSPQISISTPFNFFARSPTSLYVNNNGVISFDAPVSAYTPNPFPIPGGNFVLLSPYWADVDTRPPNGGFVHYREITDPALLNMARDQIRAIFPEDFETFTPTFLFIATWDHVGYYNSRTDKTNTFQCVLMSDGTYSFVSFLYADGLIQWTTGDASGGTNGLGGTPAQGGFNAGDGVRFFSIPGSQTAAILNISSTSNVGIPGVWTFRVDQNSIEEAPTINTTTSINECAFGLDSCDANAVCNDTEESYTCACGPGFSGNGFTCTNIDECALGIGVCGANGACVDTIGSFTCVCDPGYTGNGIQCINIDECTTGTHNCDMNAVCTDTIGSFVCSCMTGYFGPGDVCYNINECENGTDNCHVNAQCFDTVGSFSCSCLPGFRGDGVMICADIDECSESKEVLCFANSDCVNTIGSYDCVCRPGYLENGTFCMNVNECMEGTDSCHTNADCTDTVGSFQCTCSPGYSGDGIISCNDIDECLLGSFICEVNTDCVNTVGGYDCVCSPGYTGFRNDCMNVNECMEGTDSCHTNADCTDTVGSFQCTCSPGYSGDGVVSCNDIDECLLGSFICEANTDCVNTVGGYDCVCSPGYTGFRNDCMNVNECMEGTDSCHTNADCTDTVGSFQCTCNPGYSGDGVISCNDIDECLLGNFICEANTDCVNTIGGYDCVCSPGYTGFRNNCMNVDECLDGTHNCDVNANCTDTIGSFECTCVAGYAGDGVRNCTDVDECVLGEHNCDVNADCMDIEGSFYCICRDGYAGSGTSCSNVDECADETDDCHADADCTDNIGSFSCMCSSGYSGDGIENCTDIDECVLGTYVCDVNAYCENTIGSYDCVCTDGYRKNGTFCMNVDECAEGTHNCHDNADCYDVIGSFVCTCSAGYSGDGVENCTDIDECVLGTYVCDVNAYCENTIGSYDCVCTDGYRKNGTFCMNIDECAEGTHNCHDNADCYDVIGSFVCTCSAGYSGDGVENCTDVDECVLGTYVCDVNAYCENTIGSYDCVCVDGYRKNGTFCMNVNECSEGTDNCHEDADCYDTIGNFTCICSSGYSGDGVDNCTDIDECVLGAYVCDVNAYCENTIGSYDCVCVDGYRKNGTFCMNVNECNEGTDNCHEDADCYDTIGNFTCVCSPGYSGDGVDNCTDIDECILGTYVCDVNAYCENTIGNYDCVCVDGYRKNGTFCMNVDECMEGTDSCHTNADCTDTVGSFQCTCSPGYSGDGVENCTDVDECIEGTFICDPNAFCTNTIGFYTCTCRFGYSGDGNTCIALPVPDPPLSVQVTSVTTTTVSVTWSTPPFDPTNRISFYNLTVGEDTFGLPDIEVMYTGLTFRYTFTGLEEYVNYTCDVISVGVFGTFSAPASANFTTLEAVPTRAPQSPYGVAISPYLVDIIWLPPPAIDINGEIDFYIVEATELIFGQFMTYHAVEDHIFAPARPGYAYRCRVAAFTVGQGPFTDYFIVTSQELAPSAPPENVTASSLTSSSFFLDWDPPPIEQQNGVIRNYTVSVELLGNATAYNITTNDTEYSFTTLLPFYTYRITVAAVTEPGMGPASPAIDVVLPESAPSAPPQNIDGFAVDHMTIQLMWAPPPLYQQNGVITSYLINVTERETGLVFTRSTTDLRTVFTNLHPDYVYECRVAAITVAQGPYTLIFAIRVLVSSPSSPPLNFVATPTNSRSIALRWDPPLPEDRNGPITSYLVNVTVIETGEVFEINTTLTTFSLLFLTPFTTYEFTIAASTEVGLGPYSETVSVLTPEDVPSEPRSFVVSIISGSPRSLSISWLPPEIQNGIIISYAVYCMEAPESDMSSGIGMGSGDSTSESDTLSPDNSTVLMVVVPGNETEVTFPDLVPYTVYSCYASASTSAGEGNFTSRLIARTDESVPDDAPGDLEAAVVTARTCLLTWLLPTVPNGVLTSHTITYNLTSSGEGDGGGGLAVVTVGGGDTSVLITDLHPYEYYQFTVFASTRIGNSPISTVAIRTEEASPATPPRNVFSFVISPRSASVSWLIPRPEDQNGIIRYYLLRLVDERLGYDDVVINTTLTSYTFTELEEYNLYSYSVAAATSAGVGNYSGPDQFITQEDVPTAPPQNITNTVHSATRVSFVWSPPPPREVNGLLRFYIIELLERYTRRDWIFFAIDPDISISSLHPYYLYDFKVTAYTIDRGPYSEVVTVLTDESVPIAPPQEVTADDVASMYLTLTWNAPPFEETNGIIRYYMIRVSELETGTSFFVTSNETEVTVPELHPYYTYECNVAAYTIDLGPYSTSITIQLLEEAPTAEPLGVSGSSLTSESISLSWDPPPFGEQNGRIRQYLINVTELDTGASFLQTSSGTEFTVFSLHPNYYYAFTVAAVTVGAGPPSPSIVVQTNEDVPSGPVVNPTIEVTSSTSLFLRWDPPELEDQNGVIIGYVVNVTAVETGMTFQLSSSDSSLMADGLRPFTTYICRIAARTAVGVGPYSIAVTAVTQQDAPSGSPQNVSVVALGSTSLSISWDPPALDSQNGIITEYRINITELETGNVISLISFNTFITVQFLHPYYTYASVVSAVTNAEGPSSGVLVITTPQDVPNGYPQNFVGTATTSRSALLTWDPPLPEEQNGIIINYIINVTEADSGVSFQLFSANTSLLVESLLPFTSYNLLIAASTSVGTGPFSRLLTLQTLQDVPENPPLNPVGVATNSRTIQFSWGIPLGRHNGIIREYRANVTELQTGRAFRQTVTTTSVLITSLQPSYTYRLSVSAYTVGEGPYSPALDVTTPENVPSGSPRNFMGVAQSSDTIILTWDPPLVQNRNGIITHYIINATALDTGDIIQYITPDLNLTLNSLTPFSTYAFIIAARTSVGAGPFSRDITIQTLEDAPASHPSNSTGYALNSTHIYLTWDPPPPEDVNGVIREYRINVTEIETGDLRQLTTPPDVRELVVGPLHPYYSYRSTIVAFTIEVGPYSTAITVRTEEDAPSGPPTNFNATVIDSRSILLSWDPPVADQRNGILRHYFVSLVSDAGIETRNITASQRSLTVTGLRPYTEYSCTVRAGTVRTGPPTAALLRTTFEDAPGGAPQSVVAEAISPTVFTLRWLPPLMEDVNGIVTRYTVNVTELETGGGRVVEQFFTTETNVTVESRHPFYRYRYLVAAETSVGLGPFSDPNVIHMPEAAPASSPVRVTAASLTSTGFFLSWASPPAQDHNGVIRNYTISLTEINSGNVLRLVSQTTSQLFDSLQPYYNYSVQVAAVTVAPGPFSAPLVVTTLEDVPSGSPQNLVVVAETSRSLRLTWEPPFEENRNGIIVSYTVSIVAADDGTSLELTATGTTSIVAADLRPFTTYTCSVTASTSVGLGPSTPSVLLTTPEDAPEAAPTEPVVLNTTSTSVSLSWDAPPVELQNGVIRHYQIVAFEVNTNTSLTYRATANTAFIVGELHPHYTYRFAVQAVTVATGPLSTAVSVLTLQDVPSDVPLDIQATPVDSQTLTLTWSAPSEDARNGIITQYLVNISVSETGERFQRIVDGVAVADGTLTLTDLHPYYEYSYVVAAATAVGTGPFSVRSTVRMPQDVPSSTPLRLVGQAVNSERILLSWDLPEPAGRNGIIRGYTIRVLEVPTGSVFSYNLTNHTDFLVESLHPYYDYECSVAAATVVGFGPLSEPVTVRTNESVPSGSPLNLTARTIDSTTIELVWSEPPVETHNGIIISYFINISISNTKTSFVINTTAPAAPLNITELHPYYDYSLRVAAVTSPGTGPFSEPVSITTPEDVPTGAPRNLAAAAVSSTSISFTWEAPSFELQNGIIRSYHINVTELETGEMRSYVTPGIDTLLILNSLHPFYRYNYSIGANTTALGPIAYTVIQTQQEAPSSVPQSVSVVAVDSTSARVSWQPPPFEDRNGIITGYHVRVLGLNTPDNIALPPVNATMLLVEDLHPFYAYRFSVAAETVAIGPYSTAVTQKLPEGMPIGIVSGIEVSVTSPSSIRVSWQPTDNENWNGVIQRYTIVYERLRSVGDSTSTPTSEGSGFGAISMDSISIPDSGQRLANNPDPTLAVLPLRREQVTIEGLEEYHVYRVAVYYETSQGRSDRSSPATVQTSTSAPSGPPLNIRASALSDSAVVITWDPPAPLERNGIITGYIVNITGVQDGGRKSYPVSESSGSLRIEGLGKYTEYSVTVAARTAAGVGPFYAPGVRVRTEESIPGAPTDVVVSLREGGTSVELTWQAPADANGIILEYQVIYFGYKGQLPENNEPTADFEVLAATKTANVEPSNTMTVITDLTARINYAFTVRARTSQGYGANSTQVTIEVEGPDKEPEPSSSSNVVIAVVLAILGWALVVVAIIIAIAVAVFFKRRRKIRKLPTHLGSGRGGQLGMQMDSFARSNPLFDECNDEVTEKEAEAQLDREENDQDDKSTASSDSAGMHKMDLSEDNQISHL